MTTTHRICTLCGRAFVLVTPPSSQETERDRLCGECAALPKPPVAPEEHIP